MNIDTSNTQTGTYDSVRQGIYTVDGFEFISKDDAGNPIFKEYNGELKVAIKFTTPADEPGPAMTLLAPEFVMLVHAFGGTEFNPTPIELMTSPTLEMGKKLANEKANPFTVTVTNERGWVNTNKVKELRPPDGKYMVEFMGAHRRDRDLEQPYLFQTVTNGYGNKQQELIFEFKIVGDAMGKPSPFNDYKFSLFVNSPFTDIFVDVEGNRATALERGKPVWISGKNASRWEEFIKHFAPSVMAHEWQSEPSASEYGVCEILYPQVVIINKALEDRRKAIVWCETTKSGYFQFDLAHLPRTNDVVYNPVTLANFVTYVKAKWQDRNVFNTESPITFTEDGRKWAEEFLGGENGFWVAAELSLDDKRFEPLTSAQIAKLLEVMKSRYGEIEEKGW